ncbi:reverse transcriptase domain-containing protein [Enterobacter chuandaensis]|uniref:reverse transcriptase domain-containing protein n=1 Tax=Enterobacter chuandaensis TaxID=2497875 RepID=UPI001C2E3A51|nr:reverse transcriptase domain-containing protein [Enterobacter chuandaensis]
MKESDSDWQMAYAWLCRQRKNAPASADVWDLRWWWPRESEPLYRRVTEGRYRLSPMLIQGRGHMAQALWSARDALVLKWVSLQVQSQLPQHEACMHLRGRGVRMSLREVSETLRDGWCRFVHRTDIRGYYQHIQKHQVMNQVRRYVTDPVCCDLIQQYVYYSVEDGGDIRTPLNGIPRGCALSPLIGGSLLRHIDGYYRSLNPDEVFYARYMDDFLLLTRTRWQLRRSITRLGEFFDLSGFARHPDKTQTGRVEKGFDWLGVWFGAKGPTIAPRALNNHRERSLRLFEQAQRRGMSEKYALSRVQAYDDRWQRWADGMLLAARY